MSSSPADTLKRRLSHAPETAERIGALGEWLRLEADEPLIGQFERADHFHFLISGEVAFSQKLHDDPTPVELARAHSPFLPVGASGFGAPGRYAVSARTTRPSRVLRWRIADLWKLFYSEPRHAAPFLDLINAGATALLAAMRDAIETHSRHALWEARPANRPAPALEQLTFRRDDAATVNLLRGSAFFRELTERELSALSEIAVYRRVAPGETVLEQGQKPDGLYMLVRGRVELSYQQSGGAGTVARSMGRAGTVLNWLGLNGGIVNVSTVTATRDTMLLVLPADALGDLARRNAEFGFVLGLRMMWLLGQALLSARTRLTSDKTDNEVFAIQSLVEQKSGELPVRSALYKVPHLVRDPLTRPDAFRLLYRAMFTGSDLERGLSDLLLDALRDLERETRFCASLAFLYERVAGADRTSTRGELLDEVSRGMRFSFEEVPYVVSGLDNLPENRGIVTIYNHLACNPAYQLANQFAFTLDSHFVSLLLDEVYGMPGVRVVKLSDRNEFWHAGYYSRLRSIRVGEVGDAEARARFYRAAGAVLAEKCPLVIAPEGTNNAPFSRTESSPGPFQAGAFVLTQRVEPEPMIVPVALANFDKSIKSNVFAAVVKPPFRLSERVSDPSDRAAMDAFLESYREEFRGHVTEARALARAAREGEPLPPGATSNLDRLDRLDREFSSDVFELEQRLRARGTVEGAVAFYGSSSFRQWTTLASDIGCPQAVNLGFGGSTLEACAHFFDRLVLPQMPRALFLYAGDNDIGNGRSADDVAESCRALLHKVGQHLGEIPIRLLSIKPSPYRAPLLDEIRRANQAFAHIAAGLPHVGFVDIHGAMLRGDGRAEPALFEDDMLHMNARGYAIWAEILRPFIAELSRPGTRLGARARPELRVI